MSYEFETLLVAKAEGIATVTLNRPEKLNAINGTMHHELERVWVELEHDEEVRAVILTGAGKAFSAGGDAQGILAGDYHPFKRDTFRHARRLITNLLEVTAPVVAAINGDCVGLGANLALFCDVIFASESARIGDPHVRMGTVTGDGAAVIWPLLIGPARAKSLLMTGDLVSAREAERIGLVTHLVGDGESVQKALAYAQRLLALPPLAVRGTKHAINQIVRHQFNLTFDAAMALESVTLLSQDHHEAVQAFLDKRPGDYEGR